MSSTGQATSSTDNVQLIIGALAGYAKETGIDLSKNPLAAKFEQSRSPDAILQLLGKREKAFKEYRNGKRGLMNCLNPVVKVLYRFSGILSEASGLVSHSCHLVLVGLLT
jgi:fungal STAND N-terminal Goodbye domain